MEQHIINSLKNYFKDKPVNKAYLFGSYARNEDTPASDIDILVELEYIKGIGMAFIHMHQELEKELNKKVDLVSAQGLSKYIKPYIDNEKVLIYERK